MKKISLCFILLMLGLPSFSDLINPSISREAYLNARAEKKIYNQRLAFVTRVCGPNFKDNKDCKVKLKSEIKELEKFINEYKNSGISY